MSDVTKNLRGNVGETVQIRVLRQDSSGSLSELLIPVTREQIIAKPG